MKSFKHLSLLCLAVLAASCNEKISPELKNGATVTTGGASGGSGGGGGGSGSTDFTFKVENTSPVLLNYQLHRTGAGNWNTECKVSTPGVAFDNTLYRNETCAGSPDPFCVPLQHDQKTYDISCYFEAEELSMYNNGLSFKVTASPNTCEYVAYAPYSYYDRMPGDSTTTYTQLDCGDNVNTGSAQAYLGTAPYTGDPGKVPVTDNGGMIGCGDFVDANVGAKMTSTGHPIVRDSAVLKDQDLCRFDYSDDITPANYLHGSNCDIGTVTVNKLTVSVVDATATPLVYTHRITKRQVNCGGKVSNCVRGPILLEPQLNGYSRGMIITATNDGRTYEKAYSLPSLIQDHRFTNVELANFRRFLGAQDLDFITSGGVNDQTYWRTDPSKKAFDPNVMDYYASNRFLGTSFEMINTDLTLASGFNAAAGAHGYYALPLAAEPMVGYRRGNVDTSVNPFYTFYCFDSALDVKARIRMVVRDWDRLYNINSNDNNLENISDYAFLVPNNISRMDNPDDFEIPGSPGQYNSFNDFDDWDNLIFMDRTSGPFVSHGTIWNPTTGFFNINNFRNGEI